MKWYHRVISFHFYQIKWNNGCQTSPYTIVAEKEQPCRSATMGW
jgi:hypothetical protein